MSDPFEHQLQRLFAEPMAFADSGAFTARVQARLERGWAMRRVLIGAAGVAGGLIAAAQVVGANLVQRASAASATADSQAKDLAADLVTRGHALLHAQTLPIGGEALWTVAGLAALGLGLAFARVMEQF